MKPLKIHIGGLTEPKNISEVAKLYPDFMGFVFYSFTPKYYRYQSLPEIPSSIKKLVLFSLIHFAMSSFLILQEIFYVFYGI